MKITVTRTNWRQEKDHFIIPFMNVGKKSNVDFWPVPEYDFQFLAECLEIKQKIKEIY